MEIAAVLVIIVALSVTFWPPLPRRAREMTYYNACQSQLKQCVIALNLYWLDYDNHLPSSALVDGAENWNKRDFARFATRRGELPPGKQSEQTTWTQLLHPYMEDKHIAFCPRDSADPKNPESRVSYWWKAAVDRAWYGDGCARPCRRVDDFAYPVDQIVLYEHKPLHFPETDLTHLVNGAGVNVACLDTRVKRVSIFNGPKRDTQDPSALGEPMYFNFDNTKPKGPGNPPDPEIPASYSDPTRYSDRLE